MKRKVKRYRNEYGVYYFDPPPEGQRLETMPGETYVIDNEEVVTRYIQARKEFEAASDAVRSAIIQKDQTRVCDSCRGTVLAPYYSSFTSGYECLYCGHKQER